MLTTGEEFDWGGVYPDDEDEVTERVYDVPEELDVRDYARTLGVDLDDLNMSMVDKSMFSVANMTNRDFEELESRGLVGRSDATASRWASVSTGCRT